MARVNCRDTTRPFKRRADISWTACDLAKLRYNLTPEARPWPCCYRQTMTQIDEGERATSGEAWLGFAWEIFGIAW